MKNFKKPAWILVLILAVFFLKGVFVATLHPMFDGQDEARHYNSLQTINEPTEKNWETITRKHKSDKEVLDDYNFTEEIIESGHAADFDKFRHSFHETVDFSDGFFGKNETLINSRPWKPYNVYIPADTAGTTDLYHRLGGFFEKIFSSQSILVRFYFVRILSVLLGTFTVLLSYLIFRSGGFSRKNSLLLAAILAFHPKFTDYFTTINYDILLIPMFFLFTWGGVLALKKGSDWKNFSIMILASVAAFLAKGTGIVLFGILALLLLYLLYTKIKKNRPRWLKPFYIFGAGALFGLVFFFKKYIPSGNRDLFEIFSSLGKYLDASLTPGHFALTSRTYWGSLSWIDSWTLANFTDIIEKIEWVAIAGLIVYFFSKNRPAWLPEKKCVALWIFMITALQLGIRVFDWNVFASTGSLTLGTPGRYFLPNLASHLALVFVGLGTWLRFFKKEKYFSIVLKTGLILMFSLSLYIIFDALTYRYYL